MAADSAVMVIDASKGVEAQTRKLFKVCVMRHIPIFTFINKMDRDANDTFELLDDIEKELGIATCPINWPIGSGKQFKGVYDRNSKEVMTFADTLKGTKEGSEKIIHIDDPALSDEIGEEFKSQLMDEIELLDGASADFDMELVTKGELSPVFFGSALTNFGVETFLQHFLKMTYAPTARQSDIGMIDPFSEDFSAFVFKIQANMNKNHRDRIAFMRICSGQFTAGMEVYHVQGGKRPWVIVQNNMGNQFSPTSIVVPLTTKMKRLEMPTHVAFVWENLEQSMVECEQVRVIDITEDWKYVCTLPPQIMSHIDTALRNAFFYGGGVTDGE